LKKSAKNRVKDAMNMALIAIGIHREALRKHALAVSRNIGKIEVNHGQTGCRTPMAEDYILKAVARAKK
jgi:hypothetical protein